MTAFLPNFSNTCRKTRCWYSENDRLRCASLLRVATVADCPQQVQSATLTTFFVPVRVGRSKRKKRRVCSLPTTCRVPEAVLASNLRLQDLALIKKGSGQSEKPLRRP